MKKIALIFGGKSYEHEVSVASAKLVYCNFSSTIQPSLIWIDHSGNWYEASESFFTTGEPGQELVDISAKLKSYDYVFPIMHGPYGEDGCMQGFLEVLDIAYIGPGVLASASCMDKVFTKKVLSTAGIKVTKYKSLYFEDKIDIDELLSDINLPVFVKPACSGSSVGIQKVNKKDDLNEALQKAFIYDPKVIIEESIDGLEIECSVLGLQNPRASLPASFTCSHEFYDYSAKRLDTDSMQYYLPAKLDQQTIKSIQKLAIDAYQVMQCDSMARVDFFLSKSNELYVNELNTIPGLTSYSLYAKMWEASGLSFSQLLDELIVIADKKHKAKMARKLNVFDKAFV